MSKKHRKRAPPTSDGASPSKKAKLSVPKIASKPVKAAEIPKPVAVVPEPVAVSSDDDLSSLDVEEEVAETVAPTAPLAAETPFEPTGDPVADRVFIEGTSWTGLPSEESILRARIDVPVEGSDVPAPELFMQWLMHPLPLETFHKDHFENKPCLVSRDNPKYNSGWLNYQDVRELLNSNSLKWGIDFTVHKLMKGPDGKSFRKDFGVGKKGDVAIGKKVLKLHDEGGCSIRFLAPQLLSDKLMRCTQLYEAYFNNFAGNNIYYTPANAAGFAPHWDDVDAWLVQCEGAKDWCLWAPPLGCELPRHYSIDFNLEELGDPDYQFRLEAGDLLYIPRGWIHSGKCDKTSPSLHMTLSSFYRHTWADLLRGFMMNAIRDWESSDLRLRQGLPRDLYRLLGSTKDLDCSPFEHWPVDPKKLKEIGPDGYRQLIGKQAREGCHSLALARVVANVGEDDKLTAKSANQLRKATKQHHAKMKGPPAEADEDTASNNVESLKRRTRIGSYVRQLLLEIMGVKAPISEKDEDTDCYERLQNLPLDETVDLLARDFYGRRLPVSLPARYAAGCPTEETFQADPKFASKKEHAAAQKADRLETELSELDFVRLYHPDMVYPMLKPKPAHDDPPAPKVEEDDAVDGVVDEKSFLLIHTADNATSVSDMGNLDLSEPLELPLRVMCSIKFLQESWPKFVMVKDIPMISGNDDDEPDLDDKGEVKNATNEDKSLLATELFACGILQAKNY